MSVRRGVAVGSFARGRMLPTRRRPHAQKQRGLIEREVLARPAVVGSHDAPRSPGFITAGLTDGQATACGKATGLRFPLWSTARMPNCTLSFEMSSVTEVTLPTGSASVQSESVVSRITTSYPVRLVSGFAFQSIVVRLVPEKVPGGVVGICAFLGVLGEEASPHKAAPFTPVPRAM